VKGRRKLSHFLISFAHWPRSEEGHTTTAFCTSARPGKGDCFKRRRRMAMDCRVLPRPWGWVVRR